MSNSGLKNSVPRHVAIIMDGNGRWAQQRGLDRTRGHEEGAESVMAILRACKKTGVRYLTLFAFSTENWSRPKQEINALMRLLVKFLRTHETDLHEERIRLRTIGRTDALPKLVQSALKRAIKATESYDQFHLILALSYGARDEISRAVRRIAQRVERGELDPAEIDENTVAQYLDAPDAPDPDLMIRTSGEMRLSNFMLWQLSYAELYVTETLWPDFREAEFFKALDAYSARTRRFGRA